MFHSAFPNRSRSNVAPPKQNYFDFAISERPIYTRGSGPPLQKITPIPSTDNDDGFIIKILELSVGEHRYLVGSKTQPGLQVSVKMMDILNWVSSKTLEDWHFASKKAYDESLRLLRVQRKAKKKNEDERSREDELSDLRKKRASLLLELEGEKMVPGVGLVQEALAGPARRRPSNTASETAHVPRHFMSPSTRRQRGLAEIVASESDGEDNQILDMGSGQNADIMLANTGRETVTSQSRRKSPRKTEATSRVQDLQRSSRQSTSLQKMPGSRKTEIVSSSSSVSNPNISRKAKAVLSVQNRPPSSSLKTVLTENPQKTKPGRPSSQTMLQQYLVSGQTRTNTPPTRSQRNEGVGDKTEEEEEWEVECILADQIRTNRKGKQEVFYLIRWAGEWDDTWEPRKNVGRAAIKEYQAAKKAAESTNKKQNGDRNQLKRKRESEVRTEDPGHPERRMVTGAGTLFHRKSREVPLQILQRSSRSSSGGTSLNDGDRLKKQVSQRLTTNTPRPNGRIDGNHVVENTMAASRQRRESSIGEDDDDESLFVRQDDAPGGGLFSEVNGNGNGIVQGKQVVRLGPIDIDSSSSDSDSPLKYPYPVEEVNKVVVISSGKSDTDDGDDDDSDDDGNEYDEHA